MMNSRRILSFAVAVGILGFVGSSEAWAQREGSDVQPLKDEIAQLVLDGDLKALHGTSLTKTLTAAQNRWDRGNAEGAVTLLYSFIATVQRLLLAGQISEEAADSLIGGAYDLIDYWEGNEPE